MLATFDPDYEEGDKVYPDAWAAAWAEGRRMTTDQATAYALDTEERVPSPPEHDHPGGLTDRGVDVLHLVARG